jgi:hypothetical protein
MNIIPVTVLDNFFDNPDEIREFALKQEFTPSPDGKWPGTRTNHLYQLDQNLFNLACKKLFALFFESQDDLNYMVDARFQLIDESFNAGWVHTDGPDLISVIVYLSPTPRTCGGTTISRLKHGVLAQSNLYSDAKHDSFTGKIEADKVEDYRQQQNSQFEDDIVVSNRYNRLVAFDSKMYHRATNFFSVDGKPRLTLVMFISKVYNLNTPVIRMKNIV